MIINNEHFKDPEQKVREGTQIDEENLVLTLLYLGYVVEVYRDLHKERILDVMKEYGNSS